MEIWFADDDTAEMCGCVTKLATRWGPTGGRAVGRKLLQLQAAPSVEALRTLPGGLCHDTTNDTWMIKVEGVAVITFELGADATEGLHLARVLSVTDLSAERKRR